MQQIPLSFYEFYRQPNSQARYQLALQMLYEQLSPAHCLIGRFVNGSTQVETVCYNIDGIPKDNISYELDGTPCNDAMESTSVCTLSAGLQEKYFKDDFLFEYDIKGYMGVTLRSLDGTPIGIMVCLFKEEQIIPEPEKAWFRELSLVVGAELNHNLEVATRDRLLKHLRKGERIAKLSSWTWKLGLDHHFLSEELNYLLGADKSTQVTINDFIDSLVPRDSQRLAEILNQIKARTTNKIDVTVRHKNSCKRKGLFHITGRVETSKQGEPVFTATIQDISQLHALTKQLELTNVVFEHATEAIMITDHNNKIIIVNKAFEELTGYTGYELMGRDPSVLSSGRQSKQFYRDMWTSLLNNGVWKGEILNRRKNGQVFPEELTLSVVRDELNKPCNFVAIFRDISDWKRTEAQLRFYANHEPLTGLINRRSFINDLEGVISDCRAKESSGVVLFIGIDRFKEVNDVFGSEIGDKVLYSAAKRLKNGVRRQDLVCRYGGDEFAILLSNNDINGAKQIAEKLLEKISLPYVFNDLIVEVSASIGMAELTPKLPVSASELVIRATHALSSAKRNTTEHIALYDEKIQNAYREKLLVRDRLKHALRYGLLRVCYQPIIDAKTFKISKLEALVRWCDAELGQVSPAIFIPIAEEFGLIPLIGQFVLEQSCHDLALVRKAGFKNVSMSINRSVNEFKGSNDQVRNICQALELHNLPYDALTIEVTESVAANQYTWQVLGKLQERGVKVALDDFCTGYSSLSHLIHSKVDFVKIDRSFIDTVVSDSKKQAMIKYLINLGTDLGIELIAEGVEQDAQHELVREFGCHYVQGFNFSPAIEIEKCINMLKDS